ncbi:hypothetical protein DPEC_G00155860 [Dallia pectoralis]|uniref:Uncharacterized protein n=1 Tax=Dallia pectoralis TaxID=75939 RepID=A0ACC2GKI1_DALPE|nr:hypothetical protein DPEC_G00155860 [Dallia pectoralis]
MGSNYLWCLTSLPYSILVWVLILWGVHGNDDGSQCYSEIRVKRNTVQKASPGDNVEINCTVTLCPNSPPVLWKKVNEPSWDPVNRTDHVEINVKKMNNSETSFLIFKNISTNDSGLYRCIFQNAVGHAINVTVSESVEDTTIVIQKNETNATSSQTDSLLKQQLHYVYITVGIVGFVIVIITITMLLIRGCKGVCPFKQSKKEKQPECQYTVIPMTQQVSPRPNPRPHQSQSPQPHHAQVTRNPDLIYDNAPAKGPRVQDAANQVSVPVDSDCTYGNMTAKEEEGGITYAALNHPVRPRSTPRSKELQEECSEYAAIRVS